MNNKLNIEEIKLLIPDYVTGSLDQNEYREVEEAISGNPELRDFYLEMKDTLGFVNTVKPEEPSPVYWNNLLPRIHEKIELQQSAGFSWEKLSVFWKVFAPVAAIVLIAVLYFALRPSDIQLTEDKKTENVTRDSMKNPDIQKDFDTKEKPQGPTDEKKEIVKEKPVQESPLPKDNDGIYYKKNLQIDNQTANDVTPVEEIKDVVKDVPRDENLAADIEESSIFASGESAGLDEETEAELKKLDDKDRNKLLEELLNSNL